MGDPADFHTRLASLCAPEIAAAMRDQDCDRAADMITALAEILGKIIATEAAGMAGVINLATAIKNRTATQ